MKKIRNFAKVILNTSVSIMVNTEWCNLTFIVQKLIQFQNKVIEYCLFQKLTLCGKNVGVYL